MSTIKSISELCPCNHEAFKSYAISAHRCPYPPIPEGFKMRDSLEGSNEADYARQSWVEMSAASHHLHGKPLHELYSYEGTVTSMKPPWSPTTQPVPSNETASTILVTETSIVRSGHAYRQTLGVSTKKAKTRSDTNDAS